MRKEKRNNLPPVHRERTDTGPATPDEIFSLIEIVEDAKQIDLTDNQRLQLAIELNRLKETYEELKARAESVKLRTTYGTISFEYWVKDLVCLRSEAEHIAERIIQERVETLRRLYDSTDATLTMLGLLPVEVLLGSLRMDPNKVN